MSYDLSTMNALRTTVPMLTLMLNVSCATPGGGELATFEWMIGDWVTTDGAITEHWHAVGSMTFEGRGITTSQESVSTESMRLVHMEGGIFFIAKVGHNELPVAFRLTGDSTPGHSIFANPDHDFPRQLVYEQDGPDGMIVTVSDGGSKGFQLRFEKR